MTTTILALDLGTITGWALRGSDGHITSGSESFRPQRFEGGGMRFLRFKRWLTELKAITSDIDCLHFEEVRRHVSTDATSTAGLRSNACPGKTSARNRRSTAFLPTLLPSNGCWKSCAGSNGWRRNTGTWSGCGPSATGGGTSRSASPATARRHGGTGSGHCRRSPTTSMQHTSMSRCAHSQYAPRSET